MVENRNVFIPLAFGTPLEGGGVPVGILSYPFVYGKTKMVWLPDVEKTLMICLVVSTEYRRVTDGRTDGQTDRHLATA